MTMLDTAMRELDEAQTSPVSDDRRRGLVEDAQLHGEIALEELRELA